MTSPATIIESFVMGQYDAVPQPQISPAVGVFYLAAAVLMVASFWKIFVKAGKPGWAAIVPIYNLVVYLQIVNRPVWWIVLLLVPIVNVVVAIIVTNDLAKAFGKGIGWTLGMLFLGVVFYPMLAFGSEVFVGRPA